VYREGSREGVLITEEEKKKEEAPKPAVAWDRDKTQILIGKTVKLHVQQDSLYVTANIDSEGNVREVFINMGKSGGQEKSYTEAIGRLISKYLQLNGDVNGVISSLKGIKSNDAIAWDRGIKMYSVPDAIAKALEIVVGTANFKAFPLNAQDGKEQGSQMGVQQQVADTAIKPEMCPECNEMTLVHESGCYTCKNCGYTKCA
jgi:ribonucleoside-diphosphate reductase alpha chain